jgi:selenocysteine-specific elongation factor
MTGQGLDALIQTLQSMLDDLPQRVNFHHPRLPIDRVFSVSGFGTVVTGTLSGGTLHVGDNIELQPSGKVGRVRGLQSYKQDVETASPGSRVAVNIAGLNKEHVQRGDVLTYPGQIHATVLVDVYFQHLPDIERALKHNAEVKFFSGASESLGNVRLLNDEAIAPNGAGWVQVRLKDALPLTRGDRFILRYPSPPQTIGGGIIVNPNPGRRWKRFQADVIHNLAMRLDGTPAERLAQMAEGDAPSKLQALQQAVGYSDDELAQALAEALQEHLRVHLDDRLYWATASYQAVMTQMLTEVAIYHQENPLRLGILKPELQSRLKIKMSLLDVLLNDAEQLTVDDQFVRYADHYIVFSDKQTANIDKVMAQLKSSAFMPPPLDELNQLAGEPVIRALIDRKQLVNLTDSIVFLRESYDELIAHVLMYIDAHGTIDAKTLRDEFATSRKYAIAVLEHLDSLGITQRVGDARQRGRNAPQR